VIALAPREAYRLWAPTYATETAISFIDEELTTALSPPLANKRLLDAGCGIGRRMACSEAALSIGVDASPEMLAASKAKSVAAADVRALPFADRQFDIVWCRLVLGHLSDPTPAYREMGRVCSPEGHLLVTDFHVDAVAAGHRRSFRDGTGAVHEVEHHTHDGAIHQAAAERAGFTMLARRDGIIGASVEDFYIRAGRLQLYERDKGLAVVAVYLFRRVDRCAF
jgi:malonyl-CoA O-methyltransferase